MSTETRTEQTRTEPKKVGEGLAEELAELLHLPVEQLRPLPRVTF